MNDDPTVEVAPHAELICERAGDGATASVFGGLRQQPVDHKGALGRPFMIDYGQTRDPFFSTAAVQSSTHVDRKCRNGVR